MDGFVFIREITFDLYRCFCIEMLLICLCWIRIIGVSRLHSTRQTLESNIALEQTGQKKALSFFFLPFFFLTVAGWKYFLTLDNGETHLTWHFTFNNISSPSLHHLFYTTCVDN